MSTELNSQLKCDRCTRVIAETTLVLFDGDHPRAPNFDAESSALQVMIRTPKSLHSGGGTGLDYTNLCDECAGRMLDLIEKMKPIKHPSPRRAK